MQILGDRVLRKRRSGIPRLQRQTQKHGVICDRVEIQRCRDLNLISPGVLDRCALCKSIGIVGRCCRTKVISVEGVFGVHVQIAKIRIA